MAINQSKSPGEVAQELRRRRQETDSLLRLALGQPADVRGARQRAPRVPPKAENLTLTATTGGVLLEWDSVPIANLLRYDIHISESQAITNPQRRFTRDSTFLFEEAVPGTTYYVRVRAVANGEQPGDWSAVRSVEAAIPEDVITEAVIADGSITTDKLADGAVTSAKLASGLDAQFVIRTDLAGVGNEVTVNSASDKTITQVVLSEPPEPTDVLIWVNFQIRYISTLYTDARIKLFKDDTLLHSSTFEEDTNEWRQISILVHDANVDESIDLNYKFTVADAGAPFDHVRLRNITQVVLATYV